MLISQSDQRMIDRDNFLRTNNLHIHKVPSRSGNIIPHKYREFLTKCVDHAYIVGDTRIANKLQKELEKALYIWEEIKYEQYRL